MFETKTRSILKTFSWRLWATASTVFLVLLMTGETTIAYSVGAAEVTLKLLLYFFHERLWDRFAFGRKQFEPTVLWFDQSDGDLPGRIYRELKKRNLPVALLDEQSVASFQTETGEPFQLGQVAAMLEKNGITVIGADAAGTSGKAEKIRQFCSNVIEILTHHEDAPPAQGRIFTRAGNPEAAAGVILKALRV